MVGIRRGESFAGVERILGTLQRADEHHNVQQTTKG
jgi:hypothetical protein